MKRNIFKALGTLLVSAAAFTMFSCGNISDSFDSKDVGYIKVGETTARTVNPTITDANLASMTNISLKGKLGDGEEKSLFTGAVFADLAEKTVSCEVGSWSFTLEGEIAGNKVSGSTTATVTAGETTSLTFAVSLVESGTEVGTLTFTLTVPGSVKAATTSLTALDAETDAGAVAATVAEGKVAYSNANVNPGAYLLTYELFADAAKAVKLTSYTELCYVASGLTTTGIKTLSAEEMNDVYTITYTQPETGAPASDKITGGTAPVTVSRFSGDVTLPTLTADGWLFNGWYNGESKVEKITPADLTANVSVVGKWTELSVSTTVNFTSVPEWANLNSAGSNDAQTMQGVSTLSEDVYYDRGVTLLAGSTVLYRTDKSAFYLDRGASNSSDTFVKVLRTSELTGPFVISFKYQPTGNNKKRGVALYAASSVEELFNGEAVATQNQPSSATDSTITYTYTGTGKVYIGLQLNNLGDSSDSGVALYLKSVKYESVEGNDLPANEFHVTSVNFTNEGIETAADGSKSLSIAKTVIGEGFPFTAQTSYSTVDSEKALTFAYNGGENSFFTMSTAGVLSYKEGKTVADLTADETGFVTVTTGNNVTATLNLKVLSNVLLASNDTVTITGKPASAFTGDSYTLTADHDDYTEPVSYKWFDGETEIAGATAKTYAYVPADTAAHAIKVQVTGANASITSAAVTITATQAVRLTSSDTVAITASAAADAKVYKGQAVTFTANVSNGKTFTETLAYQWYNGSTAIAGATTTTLNYVLTDADVATAPSITVKVTSASNESGITSEAKTLQKAVDAILYSLNSSTYDGATGDTKTTLKLEDANGSSSKQDLYIAYSQFGNTNLNSGNVKFFNLNGYLGGKKLSEVTYYAKVVLSKEAIVTVSYFHTNKADRKVLPYTINESDTSAKFAVANDLNTSAEAAATATDATLTQGVLTASWKLAAGTYYLGSNTSGGIYLESVSIFYEIVHATGISITDKDNAAIEENPLSLAITDGTSYQLNAAITAPDGKTAGDVTDTVVWTSSNEATATVDNNGLLTLLAGNGATTTITAKTSDTVKASIELTVTGQVTKVSASDAITISADPLSAKNGDTITLTATKTGDAYTEQETYEWYDGETKLDVTGHGVTTYTFTVSEATKDSVTHTYSVKVVGSEATATSNTATVAIAMDDAQKVAAAKEALKDIGWQGTVEATAAMFPENGDAYGVTITKDTSAANKVVVTIKSGEVTYTITVNNPDSVHTVTYAMTENANAVSTLTGLSGATPIYAGDATKEASANSASWTDVDNSTCTLYYNASVTIKQTKDAAYSNKAYVDYIVSNNTGSDLILNSVTLKTGLNRSCANYGSELSYFITDASTTAAAATKGTVLAENTFATQRRLVSMNGEFAANTILKNGEKLTLRIIYYGGNNGSQSLAVKDLILTVAK